MSVLIEPGDNCSNCGHPFDPHLLIRFAGEEEGGYVMCPVDGCPCVAEWAPKEGVTDEQIRWLFDGPPGDPRPPPQ